MADGAESSKNTDGIPHPFAADDGQTCSAFSVVTRSKRQEQDQQHKYQIATANSGSKTSNGDTPGGNTKPRNSRNEGVRLFERSSHPTERTVPYNPNFLNAPSGRMTEDARTRNLNQHRVGFMGSTERDKKGAQLKTDAIGPGVILETTNISSSQNWAQTTNVPHDLRASTHTQGPLRHRGRRQENTFSGHNPGGCRARDCRQQQCNARNSKNAVANRARLTNNLELLSRPSWCDAKFAYDQVLQGKAKGNRGALWFRSLLHRLLFRLGCFTQRRAGPLLFFCLMVLGACSVGLKFRALETRVEKLWVESGGVLEKELEYTKNSIGDGMGTSWQILIQTGEDTATVESLQLHLKAAVAATKVTVTVYDQDWELSDLCYKDLPDLGETPLAIEQIIEKVFPCFIMGPLDCFYEGAELLGPSTPFAPVSFHGFQIPSFTWKTLNPKALLDIFEEAIGSTDKFPEVKMFSDLVSSAGVGCGYQDRWCLDPYNPECPDLAPNKKTKEIPDVKDLINRGCSGYANKFMKWPNDLIVGGVEKDKQGNITKARGLQTLIHLMGPSNMYNFHKNNIKVQHWSLAKAENVLTMWQRKFVEEMYKVTIDNSSFRGQPDQIHAFAPSTAQDLILEFSNFSIIRVAAGYILMLVYACFTMLRCKASRSQGAVGVIGVLLVALSVMAGLGICSVIGIKFNAATTQVLPFLMLGLGVDDMFLIAHQFGEIACLNYIPFEERTGECLKRVGVSVFLTSIAILTGFLFSMIIPMPALRSFALQAAIITCFNLFCVLIAFPATLSIDLQRRRKNMLDIFCCFQSSSANDVVELSDFTHEITPPPRERPPPVARFTTLPAGPHQPHMEPEATITMHHTIQAFSNESYVTFLGPAAETTFGSTGSPPNVPDHPHSAVYDPPLTPPPRYTPYGKPHGPRGQEPPAGPREAFTEQVNKSESSVSTNSSTTSKNHNSSVIHTHSTTKTTPATPQTATSSNLVTPMVSVRSSTHSLVPAVQSRASKWFCWAKKNSRRGAEYTDCFPFLSLTDIARKYYGPFLMKKPVKITVLVLCVLLVGGSVYGCLRVRDGLDLVDILPRDTREHAAMSAQLEYFSFYNMYIITQDFDYAHKQKELHMLHHNMSELKYVVKNTDGTRKKFWLEYMRDWLKNLQKAFDDDWSKGYINETTWKPPASDEGKLAFKLLIQTGKLEETTDTGRLGCQPPYKKPCEKVNIVRLVSDDGVIREDGFYNYLTAWTQGDPLAYLASQAQIIPTPERWVPDIGNLIITRSKAITYAQMPYFLNDLRENEDFVDAIKSVRSLCEHYRLEELKVYPSGYPFLFWQQYIDLRQWLFVAMGAAIIAVSGVVALVLLNPWAAGITCLFLLIITTELLGFMGAVGIKLSAVPAVILVAAIGLGVEFTVHITLAFITSCGSREDRAKSAISHMMGPVVDGAISTFLGVVMLSGSEFDFVIRYFFQVLAVLVLIGLWNGIVVLPVVLSLMGPGPEVVPRGGGNRLKTPTPPPTPPIDEEETVCPNCNNNSASRFPRYPEYCGHYSSRDDISCMQRPYTCDDPYFRSSRPYYPLPQQRYPLRPPFHGYDYPMDPRYQCQINPGYCHPHSTGNSGSTTPRAAMDDGRVVIYPDLVMYSTRQPEHTHMQHCDSPVRVSTAREPTNPNRSADQRRDEDPSGVRRAPAQPSTDRGKHIATVTSSVTVKVRPGRHQRIPVYLQPSSNIVNHSSCDSSTTDTKFHPIHNPVSADTDLPQATKVIPSYPQVERDNLRNNSESVRVSPNIDEASDAVDSIFQMLGNNEATG